MNNKISHKVTKVVIGHPVDGFLGMTLNCIHIFIVTGSFLYTDVSWGQPVSVS